MIRITKLSGTFYGKEMTRTLEREYQDIEQLTDECTPCILVQSIEDLEWLDIDPTEVVMVD